MGYTTRFDGHIKFSRQLTLDEKNQLDDIAEDRHDEAGAPSTYCQWVTDKHGYYLEWDGNEKFYAYVEWLEWLIENKFKKWGVVLNGSLKWQGEDNEDIGIITVKDNVVKAQEATITYDEDKIKRLRELFKPQLEWYKKYSAKEAAGEVDESYIYDMAREEFTHAPFHTLLDILAEESVERDE